MPELNLSLQKIHDEFFCSRQEHLSQKKMVHWWLKQRFLFRSKHLTSILSKACYLTGSIFLEGSFRGLVLIASFTST